MNSLPAAELVQALFSDSSDALLIIDAASARIDDVNQAAEQLTGQDRGSLLQTPLDKLLQAARPIDAEELTAALRSAQRYHASAAFAILSQIGIEPIPVEVTLRPLGAHSLVALKDARPCRALENRAVLAETELSLILSTVPAAAWSAEHDPEALPAQAGDALLGWRYRYLSPAMERVTGWPTTYFGDGPQRFEEIIHPDDRAAVSTERAAFMVSPEVYFSMEVRVIGADGRERWVRSDMQATRDAHGRVVRLDGVVTDISRSKMAELSLRESQHWMTRLLETNATGILFLDLGGRISFVNPAAEQLIGWRSEELLDRDWNDLPWRAEQDSEKDPRDLSYHTLLSSELMLDRPDGRAVTVTLNAAPLRDAAGQVIGVVVTFFDVSRRKLTEEALRSSQERLSQIIEAVAEGLLLVDGEKRITFANAAAEKLLQRTRQDLQSRRWHELPWVTALDTAGVGAATINERVLGKGETLIGTRLALANAVGELRTISASFAPLRAARRGITGMVVSLTDDTARTRAEEAVRQSEQSLAREHALLRSLLNSIPDLIFFKDRDGYYRGCNPAFEDYGGLSDAAIVGRTTAELYPAETADAMAQEDREVYATGQPLRVEKVLETRHGPRVVELVLNPMHDNDGAIIGLLGVGRDISERRRLEEQLRQAGRMEAIGRLAGGVAHDFNNLLTIILGNLAMTRALLAGGEDVGKLLTDCEKAAQRAADLTNQLLGFSRRQPLARMRLDLNRSIGETVPMLERTIDARVRIQTALAADLWTVEADGGQVGQLLTNLCLNARDAMPEGGRLRIESANVHLDDGARRDHLEARSGDFVRLRIQDDGPGIPPDVKARIFEPFFTTKPFGKGTGLGLAVAFGIVQHHQGWIECHSVTGEGTRFDIYFPRSVKPAAGAARTPPDPRETGRETILLVDDEPMIREFGKAILSQRGYRVMLAEDGATAVDLYRQHRGEINLVILDLSMPNMSGKEALQHLRALDPQVHVLFASGYSADQFEPNELADVLGFVPKPYRSHDLANAVRSALDRHSHAAGAAPPSV